LLQVAGDWGVQTFAPTVKVDPDISGLRQLQHVIAAPQRRSERIADAMLAPMKARVALG